MRIHLEDVTVWTYTVERTVVIYDHDRQEEFTAASAVMEVAQGRARQFMAFETTEAAAGSFGPAFVLPVEGAFLAGQIGAPACHTDPTCIEVFGVYEVNSSQVELRLSGNFELHASGPTFRFDIGGDLREFETGVVSERNIGDAKFSKTVYLHVVGKIVTGEVQAGRSLLYAFSPKFASDQAELHSASGELRLGTSRYTAREEDVSLGGQPVLIPVPVSRNKQDAEYGEPIYATSLSTAITGEIRSISLRGEPVLATAPSWPLWVILVAAVGVLLREFLAHAAGKVLWPLYSRIEKGSVLQSAKRAEILAAIRRSPGTPLRGLQRALGLGWGETAYHVGVLEDFGFIQGIRRGRRIHLIPAGLRPEEVERWALFHQSPRTVRRLITAEGNANMRWKSDARRFVLAGLAEEISIGPRRTFIASAALRRMFDEQFEAGGDVTTPPIAPRE